MSDYKVDEILLDLKLEKEDIIEGIYKEIQDTDIVDIDDDVNVERYPTNSKDSTVLTVVKRFGRTHSKIPAIVLAAVLAINGFKIEITDRNTAINEGLHIKNKVEWSVQSGREVSSYESDKDVIDRYKLYQLGSEIEVPVGTEYHESSTYKYDNNSQYGVYGVQSNSESYELNYVSIIDNGKVLRVAETNGESISKVLSDTAKQFNLSEDSLDVVVHFGDSGWVDLTDLAMNMNSHQENGVKFQVDESKKITKKSRISEDGTVTFNDNGVNVTIKITDNNNVLLDDDSIVTGSNGQKYRISDIDYDGSILTWGVHNINVEFALIMLGCATIANLATMKKYTSETAPMKKLSERELNEIIYRTHKKFNKEINFNKEVEKLLGISNVSNTSGLTHQDLLRDALIERKISLSQLDHMHEEKGRRM